jgi:hypothetical protein
MASRMRAWLDPTGVSKVIRYDLKRCESQVLHQASLYTLYRRLFYGNVGTTPSYTSHEGTHIVYSVELNSGKHALSRSPIAWFEYNYVTDPICVSENERSLNHGNDLIAFFNDHIDASRFVHKFVDDLNDVSLHTIDILKIMVLSGDVTNTSLLQHIIGRPPQEIVLKIVNFDTFEERSFKGNDQVIL